MNQRLRILSTEELHADVVGDGQTDQPASQPTSSCIVMVVRVHIVFDVVVVVVVVVLVVVVSVLFSIGRLRPQPWHSWRS